MFSVNASDLERLAERLDGLPKAVHDALLAKMLELDQRLVAKVKDNLSGAVLNVKSGALRDSIVGTVEDGGDVITATVGSYGTKYARAQEFGATIQIPDIYPVKARALHFIYEGREIFARHVRAHAVTLPERSYLRSAFGEMAPDIVPELRAAVVEAMTE